MKDKVMRTIIFFDLPNVYTIDKRNYNRFRKYLFKEGFIMLQESVYSKISLNNQQSDALIQRIKKNSPRKGVIQLLTITEKQYSNIQYILGNNENKIINNEDRLIVL